MHRSITFCNKRACGRTRGVLLQRTGTDTDLVSLAGTVLRWTEHPGQRQRQVLRRICGYVVEHRRDGHDVPDVPAGGGFQPGF